MRVLPRMCTLNLSVINYRPITHHRNGEPGEKSVIDQSDITNLILSHHDSPGPVVLGDISDYNYNDQSWNEISIGIP